MGGSRGCLRSGGCFRLLRLLLHSGSAKAPAAEGALTVDGGSKSLGVGLGGRRVPAPSHRAGTPNFRGHRAMSATGRRKHTQLLLRSMHEGFQQGEEAPNVRSPPRSALPPSCSGPGVGARSAWHLTAGALLFAGRSDRARAVRGGCEHKEGGAGDQGVAACLPELGPPRSRRARRHGPEPAQGGRHVLHRLVTPRGRRLVTIVLFEQHYAVFGLCAAVLTNR